MKSMTIDDLKKMSIQEFLMQDATPIERAYIYAFNDEIERLRPTGWMVKTIQHVANLEAETEEEARILGIADALHVCEEAKKQDAFFESFRRSLQNNE